MLGSIIGDYVGSIYEFDNIKTKNFEFLQASMNYTDDSVLTMATARWLLDGGNVAQHYLEHALKYPCPMGGYGGMFHNWLFHSRTEGLKPAYNSCGNGSAMRVSPVGWAFDTEDEVLQAAETSAACTHNHPEGIKGAQATAVAILWARQGKSAQDIRKGIEEKFGYDLSLSVDAIRPRYSWGGLDNAGNGGTCQGSVPQAIVCALEATDFEDAIRNAVSIGGDSDTIGCITGAIAEALFGIPRNIYDHVWQTLPEQFQDTVAQFEKAYGCRILD